MRLRTRAVLTLALAAALVSTSASAADPTTPECLSANESSIKLQADHKLKDARTQALVCASASCPGEVRSECERRVAQVAGTIPSIIFEGRDGAGNDLSEVVVTMDGQPFAARLDGTAVELDPGPHAFTFEGAGAKVDRSFVIREGEKGRRERIVFDTPAGTSPAPTPGAAPASSGTGMTSAPAQDLGAGSTGSWSTQKTLALVAGGAGVLGLAVGTIFGLSASSKWSQAKSDCGSGCGPNDPAQQEKSDAQSAGNVATVAFIAGGVLVAAGVVLWLTSPKEAVRQGAGIAVAPNVDPQGAGLRVIGRF
jgi:hypothetical protein